MRWKRPITSPRQLGQWQTTAMRPLSAGARCGVSKESVMAPAAACAIALLLGVDLGDDGRRRLCRYNLLRDLLVPLQAPLQLLQHPVLRDRDHRRRTGLKALADRPQVLVLEALVADPAPEAAGATADQRRADDAGREDQPDDAAGDRAPLGHGASARVGRLAEVHLPVRAAGDCGRVEQVDRPVPVGLL